MILNKIYYKIYNYVFLRLIFRTKTSFSAGPVYFSLRGGLPATNTANRLRGLRYQLENL
ncbi:hypothetical protein X474_17185 [Dethiosulfatarculus sandiegensis]|uniref:Uncharacterized protein n=1 Tax=Dethiosulfatarculus sandiegensis TaxID=1429043 RepID=A0A0D2JAT0_9BACT|nr:hypothetical protein X474_17185 [Dethiosulfatarculus sandiegensis]